MATVLFWTTIVTGAAGLWASSLNNAPGYVWIAAIIIGVATLSLGLTIREAKIDLLSPSVIFSLVWAIIFGIRPLLMASTGDTSLRDTYNFPAQLVNVELLALVGQLSFFGGVLLARDRTVSLTEERKVRRPLRFGQVVFLVLGAAGSVLGFQASLGGTSAYVYYLPLVLVPLANISLLSWLRSKNAGDIALCLVASAIFAMRFSLTGQRAFVLYLLLSLAAIFLLEKKRSPRLGTAVAAGAVLLVGVFYTLEVQRSELRGGARLEAELSAQAILGTLFQGGTTEMAPSMSALLATEGYLWQQRHGETLYTVLVHWVPSALWEGKPKTYDEDLYSRMFPEHYAVDKANTQFSVLGDFYSDSGWLGVGIGLGVMGYGLQAFYLTARSRRSDFVMLAYAATPALLLTTFRGNLALNFGIALFLVFPLFVMTRRADV
ncbi:oligosaccharide repeat unit polymerase [Nocardioides marinus]|uniref:Oligosaccharide repeat unit polymerase n=1 Tax=Nocardioides marinus TaxID=374514 RepID=A0A7Y9YI81_9ACTN|nr:oligosaccharide repeat unit polymerase [Nocardioides marinus]